LNTSLALSGYGFVERSALSMQGIPWCRPIQTVLLSFSDQPLYLKREALHIVFCLATGGEQRRVQHHEVREFIAVFSGDRGGVNQNVAGIFRALKGISNILGLLIGHRA